MALVWADGFGHWGNLASMSAGGYVISGDTYLINDPAFARTGNFYLRKDGGNNSYFQRVIELSSIVTVGVAIRFGDLGGREQYNPGLNLTGPNGGVSLRFNNDGSISLINRANNSIVATTPINTITINTWNYYELQVNQLTNKVVARLNNVIIFDVTLNTGQAKLNLVRLGAYDGSGYYERTFFVADLYITDGAVAGTNPGFIGDVRCRTIFPTANGPDQQWPVTGAASAIDALDNVPFNPAQYISAANVGDVSNFEMGDIPANTSYVAGLVLFPAIGKTDAGVCEVTPQVTSGETTQSYIPITPAIAPSQYPRIIETDPNTGLYWTRQTVNNLRLGFKRTA